MSMINAIGIFILAIIVTWSEPAFSYNDEGWYWTWACDTNSERCQRKSEPTFSVGYSFPKADPYHYTSLAICRLTCGRYGALWPKPTISTTLSSQLVAFHPGSINFQIRNANEAARNFLVDNTEIFYNNLVAECGDNCTSVPDTQVVVFISIANSDLTLNWQTNETYTLNVNTEGDSTTVRILAETVYGARHGLETLSQLTVSYSLNPSDESAAPRELAMVAQANIRDKPVYKHRGLLIDTARNFLSVSAIKRQIDAMAASKLNVLHWHATDSQSFPLESPSLPYMAKFGAYSSKMVYKPSDVNHLLKYAKLRGVRIILEIDAPSHAGNGWQWGKAAALGDLAVCINRQPWRSYCIQPPCGQLNPVNPYLYNILGELYGDFVAMFPKGEVFHMGGDEVFFPCWNNTDEIVKYLEQNGQGRTHDDFLQLWGDYQKAALNVYDKVVGNSDTSIVLWSSALTDPNVIAKYLPKSRYVIQTWVPSSDELPKKLLSMGYKLIVSTKDSWYLDHGFWGSTLYYTWRKAYSNELPRHDGVLGGEVCMWGELVDENTIDNRVWPRAAAAAERLWSDPNTGTAEAEARFYRHRERLLSRGVQAEALAPGWCFQNEGECA